MITQTDITQGEKCREMTRGPEASPDGGMHQYRKFEVLFSASNRPASQTITDRGTAMILLPRWGRTLDWRKQKKIATIKRPPRKNKNYPEAFGNYWRPDKKTIVCCVNGGFCVGSQPVCMLHRLFIVF